MQQHSQILRRSLLVSLISGLLLVSACGGGSGDNSTEPTPPLDAGSESRDASALGFSSGSTSWVKIASQDQPFTVTQSTFVRFGTGSSWTGRWISGTGQCSVSFFGRDPASGKVKQCEMLVVSSSPPPNVPPTVTLSAPASATVGVPVTLSAAAADSDGSVAKVEFYAGANLVATDSASPFSVAWTGSEVGTVTLTAKATDNKGATTTSAPLYVTVSSSPPPPPPPPPPNVPPAVTLSAPATATVGVPITLSATAADSDGTVAKVEFYAGVNLVATDTTSPYSVAWTSSAVGTYTLTAKATDDKGATTTSAPLYVTVSSPPPPPPNVPPTVTLSAPATATVGVPVTLSAAAADSDGTVARVEFYAGVNLVATDTTSPYSVAWTSSAVGTYTLTAKAIDNNGATTTSAPLYVAVSNPPPPPGTAALSWQAPDVPVVGYRVYYGMTSGSYIQPLGTGLIADASLKYTVMGLQSGVTYYFAVTAIDSLGAESAYSNEASKLIR